MFSVSNLISVDEVISSILWKSCIYVNTVWNSLHSDYILNLCVTCFDASLARFVCHFVRMYLCICKASVNQLSHCQSNAIVNFGVMEIFSYDVINRERERDVKRLKNWKKEKKNEVSNIFVWSFSTNCFGLNNKNSQIHFDPMSVSVKTKRHTPKEIARDIGVEITCTKISLYLKCAL